MYSTTEYILLNTESLNQEHPSLCITECPRTNDRMQRFACPTPDFRGRYRCIDDRALCNGFFDCPGREDEKPDQCLFFKTVSK